MVEVVERGRGRRGRSRRCCRLGACRLRARRLARCRLGRGRLGRGRLGRRDCLDVSGLGRPCRPRLGPGLVPVRLARLLLGPDHPHQNSARRAHRLGQPPLPAERLRRRAEGPGPERPHVGDVIGERGQAGRVAVGPGVGLPHPQPVQPLGEAVLDPALVIQPPVGRDAVGHQGPGQLPVLRRLGCGRGIFGRRGPGRADQRHGGRRNRRHRDHRDQEVPRETAYRHRRRHLLWCSSARGLRSAPPESAASEEYNPTVRTPQFTIAIPRPRPGRAWDG